MENVIDKTSPMWERLYQQWISEKKPGYVTASGGMTYRVLMPSDEEVKFKPMGSLDELYGSQSGNFTQR